MRTIIEADMIAYFLLAGVVALQGQGQGQGQPRGPAQRKEPPKQSGLPVKLETFDGWVDSYRVSNGVVDVVIVPKLGRVVRYGYVGAPNLLWENPALKGKDPNPRSKEWQNFGGDKLWVAPQSMWNWPPPVEFDSGPYVGTPIPNGLKLVGPRNVRFGIHMEREITLSAKGTEVRVSNRMVNDMPITIRRSIWQITQLDNPDHVSAGLHPSKSWPDGYRAFPGTKQTSPFIEVSGGQMKMKINPDESAKYGFAAPNGMLTALKGDTTFSMTTKYEGRASYPDEGSAQEVFLSKSPDLYAELELLSPIVWLKPQESRELVVKWSLTKATSPRARS